MTEKAMRCVRALRICHSNKDCRDCEFVESDRDEKSCVNVLFEDAADLIQSLSKQLEAAQPKWISVDERLPDDRKNVLVYIAGEKEGVDSVIAISNYTHSLFGFNIEGWVSPWQYCFWDRKVTHWMPLPSDPKEET